MSYLLRLVLPDRPGMLGAVATALGGSGADILSLDVVERGPDGAVDDLIVALPPGGLADALITSAQSVPGVVVESLRPYHGGPDLHRDLELVDAVAADPHRAPQLLVEHLPGVFRAGWALLLESGPRLLQASPGAPDVAGLALSWLPMVGARRLQPDDPWVPEGWQVLGTELIAAAVGSSDRVVLVGRPGGPRFRASEVLRLGHLAGIVATVESTLD
ncbi:MAG: amino acid-binding protein [Mycobacteriales bacterium]